MDPENLTNPSDTNKILLNDHEVIKPINSTPQDSGDVRRTEKDSSSSPCRQPSKELQIGNSKDFCLPALNFDSDTSDDLQYSPHTPIDHSSKFDENREEKIDCCDNLHERYHNLYNCHLEESDPPENNPENNIKFRRKKLNKSNRLDEILAEQICIYEKSSENYCAPKEDLDVPPPSPPPAHSVSSWRQNQLDFGKEKVTEEADTSTLEQSTDDVEEDNSSDFEEDDAKYLEEQEALLNLYICNKRDVAEQRPPGRRGDRPPGRRGTRPPGSTDERLPDSTSERPLGATCKRSLGGTCERPLGGTCERPPGRRGERPCDIKRERPSSEGKQESSLCHNRYRMLNTPKRVGSAMPSQSCNNSNSRYQSLHKCSDFPCSTYYEKKTETTSQYYSTLDTVQMFFETRLDITNNVNSKYCTRKPTNMSSMSGNLPMHYSLEEIQYLGQHEREDHDDISYPSTSSVCNTIVEETFPDELPKEKKHEHNF